MVTLSRRFGQGIELGSTLITGSISSSPPGSIVHQLTSDDFFEDFTKGDRYLLIYLDGLHEASQTYRDPLNSLELLEKDGCALIDDVRPTDVPSSLSVQEESVREKEWRG